MKDNEYCHCCGALRGVNAFQENFSFSDLLPIKDHRPIQHGPGKFFEQSPSLVVASHVWRNGGGNGSMYICADCLRVGIRYAVKKLQTALGESLRQFQDTIGAWADTTFPTQTIDGKCNHLSREVKELCEAPGNIEEQADCLLLLLQINRASGSNVDMLLAEAQRKHEICKLRKWSPLDADGVSHHEEGK